ncbi:uncharacterized protein [Apostichopus japonicus]|uniref:uncharacterized protein isoform X1 n=1 Tax=Stichopus japonicus TaxID=307972 RepID=UPI003AB8DBEC
MSYKNTTIPVRKFILVISLLHIIIGITAINLAIFAFVGNCQKSGKFAGAWGSVASLACASLGLALAVETRRKFVLVYISLSAFSVVLSAFELAMESVGLEMDHYFCQTAKDGGFMRRECKLECTRVHFYIITTAVATLVLCLFSSLILSHSLRGLSD